MRNTPELSTARWRKSSYSNANGGNCVEIAENVPGAIPVRDSKTPHGPVLTFPAASWTAFIAVLKTAER
ncbi:DUF397 domain-containing protein [Streptomyces sp. NPDC007100]|uniref:DUF397 domain-containing protein n=1 Tax=Streptomyces sp. NPDC007100 TaxID=3155602 RepID=UPI0033FBD412